MYDLESQSYWLLEVLAYVVYYRHPVIVDSRNFEAVMVYESAAAAEEPYTMRKGTE